MGSMKSWMLGAAVLAGVASLASVPAQAAQFGVYVGVHDRYYVPPSPGPGYFWTAGYYSDGYWVPGRWAFRGYDRDRYYDRDDRWRDRDRDYYRDRDRDDRWRDRDRDHDRFRR